MPKIANDEKIIREMSNDTELSENVHTKLYPKFVKYKYSYNFSWLGVPIIQLPQDVMALQEIIWDVKPDLIIETGVAHGGSLIFHASLLRLLGGVRKVVGIDIDIRKQNREVIVNHLLASDIILVDGSSVADNTFEKVKDISKGFEKIMVILDSNHTHSHVFKELEMYSSLVGKGSYLVVMDTVIEDLDNDSFPRRSWGKGDNSKTAVWDFLKNNGRFEIDHFVENKLVMTACPDGFLRCIKDI